MGSLHLGVVNDVARNASQREILHARADLDDALDGGAGSTPGASHAFVCDYIERCHCHSNIHWPGSDNRQFHCWECDQLLMRAAGFASSPKGPFLAASGPPSPASASFLRETNSLKR